MGQKRLRIDKKAAFTCVVFKPLFRYNFPERTPMWERNVKRAFVAVPSGFFGDMASKKHRDEVCVTVVFFSRIRLIFDEGRTQSKAANRCPICRTSRPTFSGGISSGGTELLWFFH
jgi:predicted DNA-binding protein (UPF0251 family)